jgi:hypothetical protein
LSGAQLVQACLNLKARLHCSVVRLILESKVVDHKQIGIFKVVHVIFLAIHFVNVFYPPEEGVFDENM